MSPAPAYNFHGVLWPGGVVPYFNAASDQSWAVDQAVSAWNHSGAGVRFVAVPRAQAKLIITDPANKVFCSEGHASVGYVQGAHVVIFPARGVTHDCNQYWAAQLTAHELGHVLGLRHEDRYCATMNSLGNYWGNHYCEPKLRWAWRCRLLESDDIAGIAAMYGGKPNPPKKQALCPFYTAIAAPTHPHAVIDRNNGTIALSFQQPKDPEIPTFAVPSPWHVPDSFVLLGPFATCPPDSVVTDADLAGQADIVDNDRHLWHGKPGHIETFQVTATRGTHCYEAWALDKLGRPSLTAAKFHIRIQ